MSGKRYTVAILILCILGLLASIYAYHVETSKERDSTYQAACDISEKISCSKVFTSRWGRGFGLVEYVTGKDHVLNQPNSVFGTIFYVLQLVFSIQNTVLASSLALLLSTVGIFGCVYLGYILYFILEDFCIVCVTTYVINFFLLIVTYFRRKYVLRLIHKKSSKKVR